MPDTCDALRAEIKLYTAAMKSAGATIAYLNAENKQQAEIIGNQQDAECQLEAEITALRATIAELERVLAEIAEGKGAYSPDLLTHASTTVDDMQELAIAAIAKAREVLGG